MPTYAKQKIPNPQWRFFHRVADSMNGFAGVDGAMAAAGLPIGSGMASHHKMDPILHVLPSLGEPLMSCSTLGKTPKEKGPIWDLTTTLNPCDVSYQYNFLTFSLIQYFTIIQSVFEYRNYGNLQFTISLANYGSAYTFTATLLTVGN